MIFNAHYYLDCISFQVWICILASCIFMGSFIYIFTRWFDNIFSNSPRKLSISEVYWFIYGAILRQGSTIDPKSSNTLEVPSQLLFRLEFRSEFLKYSTVICFSWEKIFIHQCHQNSWRIPEDGQSVSPVSKRL